MDQTLSAVRLGAILIESTRPEALAEFYQRGFALEPPQYSGKDHLGLKLPNVYWGFDRVEDTARPATGAMSIWFQVADTEAVFARLLGLGATVKYAPTRDESPGEVLAIVYDPDGNSIGLISPA